MSIRPKHRDLLILLPLAVVVALLATLAWLWQTRNPRAKSVAETAAQLKAAKENLETAHRLTFATERAVMRVGMTNAGRTVHAIGDKISSRLLKERVHAEAELHGLRLAAIADFCVARFGELSTAQEAMATLSLSGIKDVIIRRPEAGGATADGQFDLMVAKSNEVAALSALKEIQIFEAGNYSDGLEALQAHLTLKSNGIPASGFLRQIKGAPDSSERVHVMFVLASDKQAAQALLGSPTGKQ